MALFDGLVKRAEAHARSASERALTMAEAAVAQMPGIIARREADALVISGRGLMRRWLGDVRLRFAFRGRR